MKQSWYLNNPLIHSFRQLSKSHSSWAQSFSCEDMKPLIICRGPIRKEAMDVFDEMGIHQYGILLSEKDSITYSNALAPELRKLTDPNRVHRVADYTGATKEERQERIKQIIQIAHTYNYDSIFAGYGFMSEDAEMVEAMENAGLNFIGPCSYTQRSAGMKDQAKRTALQNNVSVTPGVDNATSIALLNKYGEDGLSKCIEEFNLSVNLDEHNELENKVLAVLQASYSAGIDIITADDVGSALQNEARKMLTARPSNRFRLKAIAGGGGKGQRILQSADSYEGKTLEEQVENAVQCVPELVRECLIELKSNGVGDNKNVLIEMNIDTTRHQEIQVVGNGDWCITMGGRDCSLQMHEQKLLEVSVTQEELQAAIEDANKNGREAERIQLEKDLNILQKMEDEGAIFGKAVKLDSVGTFECIVDGESHYFMEMNTRIQVEHRVTELCYGLKFANPDDADDYFSVESLVEAMVLIAKHGKRLPKPERFRRENASVEARLNATNQALQPHAGGVIKQWSNAISGEIRDDQGISLHNPDTDVFMQYHLAGAYDSNIALLLSTGEDRLDVYKKMSEILRQTSLTGTNLATNLEFHYGLVNWFIGNGINARPNTSFIQPYLTAVGLLKKQANQLDIEKAGIEFTKQALKQADQSDEVQQAIKKVSSDKTTLIARPVKLLMAEPHLLAGWLSANKHQFESDGDKITWLTNPLSVLSALYAFLDLDEREGRAASEQIWSHDAKLLQQGLSFYAALQNQLGDVDWQETLKVLNQASAPKGIEENQWQAIKAAHAGHQFGLELLSLLPYIGVKTGFFDLKANDDLSITIPDRLRDKDLQAAMAKVLVPPPVAKSDEIVAVSGGMYYSCEAPGIPPFVEVGTHFNAGDPLYIVEVMKMFNKVSATVSGTIKEILVKDDGAIIKKGQPLFKIEPDEQVDDVDESAVKQAIHEETLAFVSTVVR